MNGDGSPLSFSHPFLPQKRQRDEMVSRVISLSRWLLFACHMMSLRSAAGCEPPSAGCGSFGVRVCGNCICQCSRGRETKSIADAHLGGVCFAAIHDCRFCPSDVRVSARCWLCPSILVYHFPEKARLHWNGISTATKLRWWNLPNWF